MIGNIYCVLLFFAIASPAVPSNKRNSCSLNEFMCGDGSCVVFERVCDGAPDCVDLSDERRCGEGEIGVPDQSPVLNRIKRQAKCRKFEWGCRDGSCIAFDGKCDGKKDCPDGSDETHAVCRKMRCQSNWFRCTYGACVDGTAPCNNVQECADNSDELLPRCRNETEDIRSTFRCDNGQLIAAESHCDGTAQCTDGSDETVRACAAKTCPAYLFQCAYGACVDSGADCNGVRDCADGSDEADDLCGRQSSVAAPAASTPPAPGSVPDKCVVPPFPAHGTFLSDGVLTPGDVRDNFVLNISCEAGYAVSNGVNEPIWCINGKWLGETQDCVRACRLIQNPSVSYKCRLIDDFAAPFQPCPPYVPQTMFVQPECRPGYFTSGSLAYMRCSDGNFEYSPYCTEGSTKTDSRITISDNVDISIEKNSVAHVSFDASAKFEGHGVGSVSFSSASNVEVGSKLRVRAKTAESFSVIHVKALNADNSSFEVDNTIDSAKDNTIINKTRHNSNGSGTKNITVKINNSVTDINYKGNTIIDITEGNSNEADSKSITVNHSRSVNYGYDFSSVLSTSDVPSDDTNIVTIKPWFPGDDSSNNNAIDIR